jgi:hypothetical protein
MTSPFYGSFFRAEIVVIPARRAKKILCSWCVNMRFVDLEKTGRGVPPEKIVKMHVVLPLNDSNRPCWIRDAGRFLYH